MYRYEIKGDDLGELESEICDESLIPSHNRSLERFKAFYRLITEPLVGLYDITSKFPVLFSVDEAIGKQLDIVGSCVGVSRYLPFAPISGSRELDDEDYRLLIRAKIASNNWDGTYSGLQDIINELFPDFGIVIVDTLDCNLTYTIRPSREMTKLQEEMFIQGLILPRPSGVGIVVRIESIASDKNIGFAYGHVMSGVTENVYEFDGSDTPMPIKLDDDIQGRLDYNFLN